MSRVCASWVDHIWTRPEGAIDRHCSKCGLIEPRVHDRPDPNTCHHQWEYGTFRRRCMWCGTIDRNTVLAPRRPKTPTFDRSQQWRGRVRTCWARDGEGCFYCRQPLSIDDARLDHFIPRSKGGPDSLVNRRAACKSCDTRKRDRMPWEFMPERFSPPDEADCKCVDTATETAYAVPASVV